MGLSYHARNPKLIINYKVLYEDEKNFFTLFSLKGETKKKSENFFSSSYDNLYTNLKPLSALVEI
jgi:hypothetical protein